MGDRQQRLLWLDIANGRVHRFDRAAGSDDVFRLGKPVGCGRPAHQKDQSEWQIEWQMALVWACPALVSASVCSCSRRSAALPGAAELQSDPW
jgi:hypothetical protein